MGVRLNGSSHLFWSGSMPTTTLPIALIVYGSVDSSTGSEQWWAALQNSSTGENPFGISTNGGAFLAIGTRGSAGNVTKNYDAPSASYGLYVYNEAANNSRAIYAGSASSPGVNTDNISNNLSALNRISIGGLDNAGLGLRFPITGSVAEFHLVAGLDTGQLPALYAGTLKPDELTGWLMGWQLKNATDLTDMSGTRTLTASGAVTTSSIAHPVSRTTVPVISTQPSAQTVTTPTAATFTGAFTGTATSATPKRKVGGIGAAIDTIGGTNNSNLGTGVLSYTTGSTSVTGGNHNSGDTYGFLLQPGNVETTYAALTVNPVPPDTTIPVFNAGDLVASSITSSTYTLTYPSATDNVAVDRYEVSLNGGSTWTSNGLALTRNVTGRTPGSTDQCRVRAVDAAGNPSAVLSAAVTLTSETVTILTTQILSNGSGLPLANTLINYSFFPGGRIGAFSGITPFEGSVTSSSTGTVTLYNLPATLGVLMLSYRATVGTSNSTTDKVYYEAITPTL